VATISTTGLATSKAAGTTEQLEIQDKDKQTNLEAAQSCPVNAIHVKDANGKKLI